MAKGLQFENAELRDAPGKDITLCRCSKCGGKFTIDKFPRTTAEKLIVPCPYCKGSRGFMQKIKQL